MIVFESKFAVPSAMLAVLFIVSLTLMGCAAADEGTLEEQELGEPLGEQVTPVEAKKSTAEDQALSAFIGEKKAEPAPLPTPQQAPVAEPTPVQPKTDAVSSRVTKLEQENKLLTSRNAALEEQLRQAVERADREAFRASQEQQQKEQLISRLNTPVVAETAATETAPTVASPSEGSAPAITLTMAEYEGALKLFNSGKPAEAQTKLEGFLAAGGLSPTIEDNVHYWLGESQFAQKKFKDAIASFEKVLGMRVSEKKADAQFMIAQSHQRLGDKKSAKSAYEKVVKDYPTSDKVRTAKQRWGSL